VTVWLHIQETFFFLLHALAGRCFKYCSDAKGGMGRDAKEYRDKMARGRRKDAVRYEVAER